jgi:Spy/CpxP family protein refolding chaperone
MLRGLGQSRDPLADAFFPPELVMQRQQEIGLTADQRNAIVNVIAEAQPRFVEAQWQLQPETAALAELVRGDRVDEQQVLAQIDRVLDIERQIKRLQIEMLIRIKNQLTLEQQQQLARFGGVRLRGMLDSSRPKLAPFGLVPSGDLLMESFNFTPGLSGEHDFWLDHSDWLNEPVHWPEGQPYHLDGFRYWL